jgi:hypothetical protein
VEHGWVVDVLGDGWMMNGRWAGRMGLQVQWGKHRLRAPSQSESYSTGLQWKEGWPQKGSSFLILSPDSGAESDRRWLGTQPTAQLTIALVLLVVHKRGEIWNRYFILQRMNQVTITISSRDHLVVTSLPDSTHTLSLQISASLF